MALRKPLVLVSGQVQQLQSADTLDAPQAGGDTVSLTNNEASPIVIGTPVYSNAAAGVLKARADAAGTTKAIGLVRDTSISASTAGSIQVGGVLTATTTQWDAAFGTSGGLTFGTRYYLSPTTAGIGTSTAPTTTGQYVVELGIALSTTDLLINAPPPAILL